MDNLKVAGLLSRQRHDYANHLQVIKGYLELGMPERALEYVDSVAGELARESHLFNSAPPVVSIPLYELQLWSQDKGICLRFGELEVSGSSDVMLSKGITTLYRILEDIKVPAGEEEFEIWLDLREDKEQTIISLIWPDESDQVVREIVLTR